MFKSGSANCYDTSKFNSYILRKAGYKTYILWVEHFMNPIGGHAILAFEDKNKIFILDKEGPLHHFRGPFDSLYKIPYDIRGFLSK